MILYRVVRAIVVGATRACFRVRVAGTEHLPSGGAYVLAPSHRSMMDIPFLAVVTPRRVRFLGKVQVFKVPLFGRLFRALGAIPVARDGDDRAALRAALRVLGEGEPIVVYPEGTRQHGPRVAPLQPGAAYLAVKSGVPLVPVGIAGTEEILRSHGTHVPRFRRGAVVVGPTLRPPPSGAVVKRALVDDLNAQLATGLQDALDEAYRLRGR